MRFSLQQMVQQTLAEARMREKLASEEKAETEEEEKKKLRPRSKKEEKAGPTTKTSSAFVEKLASAVEYLNSEFLLKAAAEAGLQGQLPNNMDSPTPGRQNYSLGMASKRNRPPVRPGRDTAGHGQTNPVTALETNMASPPGGSSKQAAVARVLRVMNKLSSQDAGVNIKAQHHDVAPPATPAGVGVPPLPAPAAAQQKLVRDIRAAIAYKKRQAKQQQKQELANVLREKAQSKATDPVLHNNLDAASDAGVKISAASESSKAALLEYLKQKNKKNKKEDEESEEKTSGLLGGGY